MTTLNLQNITEDEVQTLKEISKELNTQDNLSTQNPCFVVYNLKEVIIQDGYSVFNRQEHSDWYVYKVDEDTYLKEGELEDYYNDLNEEVPDLDDLECLTVGYMDEFVSSFLTRKAAEEYMARNKHNLCKPFIYVESFYGNAEIQLIRKVLQNLI